MKKIMKKSLSLVMALAVMLTGVLVIPTAGNKAAAASPSFYGNQTVYYETDSPYTTWKVNVSIFNCSKATQIKSFKNQKVTLKAKSGWQIYSVFVSTDKKNFSKYRINKSSYTIPKMTYNGRFDCIWVTYQKKSNPSEIVEVRLNMVKE